MQSFAREGLLHDPNLERMRFIGFDSFEGLPKASPIDVAQGQEEWIGEAEFCASLEEVKALLPPKGIEDGLSLVVAPIAASREPSASGRNGTGSI